MRLTICAVGRLRCGPERDLYNDYAKRLDRAGRALSLGPLDLREVEDKKGGGMPAEAALLDKSIPDNAVLWTLDERGSLLSSPEFSHKICALRDDGASDLAFVIGGADGIDADLCARAQVSVSFGKMVWPHMLVRVMLAEQLYRAVGIAAGTPYHRV